MSTSVLETVRAFLATPAVADALSLPPPIVATLGRVLAADGVIKATSPERQRIDATLWLLQAAAEHGASWRIVAFDRLLKPKPSPFDAEATEHLAKGRARARNLLDAGELTNAVDSMMATARSCPGAPMPEPVAAAIRITGDAAVLGGSAAVRRWIEVFV